MTGSTNKAWRCSVCGYVHRGETPPDCCPICGSSREDFEPYVEPAPRAAATSPQRWRCLNCGYIHEGADQPDFCPICGVPSDEFEPVEEEPSPAQVGGSRHFVIVGGGIAGISAAESIRSSAPEAVITLICGEPAVPYYRLNLTRYLAGEIGNDTLAIHDESWYSENDIEVVTGTNVDALSPPDKSVTLAGGESLSYDKLILAMGSHAFVPPIPGADLAGVLTLRTARDADNLLELIGEHKQCAVIGGGILGIETAGALARRGAAVTLIESHEWLMPRQLNRKAAAILESHLADLGVRLVKQARTQRIEGADKVTGVVLENGDRIDTPLVALTTGVRPNTVLARKAGIEVDKGIVVNNHLETSVPDIYAAGDVAEHNGTLYGTWSPSQYQGSIAGFNAVGVPTVFGGVPRSNTLKVLGVDLLSIGRFEPEDGSFTVLDHREGRRFASFVFRDCRIAGCILMDYPSLGSKVKNAVETGRDFSGLLREARTGADVIARLAEKG